ncbi:MAG: outer membrane lipoprotein chaperone LolA [Thermodesulfobacteriota bacterium]
MRRLYPLVVVLTLCYLVPPTTPAETLDTIVSRLQKRYEGIRELSADFTQETISKGMRETLTSSGRVYFRKPGMMRWEYDTPEGDLLISDGTTIWLFQADLNQVIESSADVTTTSIARNFLAGMGSIREDFDLSLYGVTGERYRLGLTPKNSTPSIERLSIDINKASFLVVRTVVLDRFGNETRVAFKNVKTGGPLDASLFTFTPPEGVVVVRPR